MVPVKHRHRNVAIVAALCAGLLVPLGLAAPASAARATIGGVDNPTQTAGSAVLYGTTAPVPKSAAAPTRAPSRNMNSPRATHFLRRTSAPTSQALTPPSPSGTPVVSDPGTATGFNGLTFGDSTLAGTGQYANSQGIGEPPDQGLCAGHGFVVEPINSVMAVYSESGTQLTAATALNQFYDLKPEFFPDNSTGDFVSDPKCYWDPVGQRFIQTILEVDQPGAFDGQTPVNGTHVLIAVSQTSDPTGSWNLYKVDTTDNGANGTPSHPGCPCLPDQPLLGANRDGVFIDTNQFQNNPQFLFNGAQLYALGRAALESGASAVVFDHLDLGTVPTGDTANPFWGSVQPAESIDPRSGTELMLSGGPETNQQNIPPLDNRIAAWALTRTGSLETSTPHLGVSHQVLASETYGVPNNTGVTQKSGPTPLRDILNGPPFNGTEPLEMLNSNDPRMNQVVDFHGILFGGVNTTVTSATGPPRVGIAYFAVLAVGTPFGVIAHIVHQGYVAVNGENVIFPSIAVNRAGVGAMAFTLSGPGFFPSAAYVRFVLGQAVGPVHISAAGAAPEDGFSGYSTVFGSPTPGIARWGDYSAALFADGAIWMGNEFIPNVPRPIIEGNFGTFITKLPG
jgi:hypothetical protein